MKRILFGILAIIFITLIGVAWWYYDLKTEQEQFIYQPEKATYVGRQSCIECHQTEHKLWQNSYHDLAMDLPTEKTVLADFNNTTFEQYGITTRFFKKDGKFYIHTEGPEGKMQDFEVSYVFGVDPLQQYLIKFPDGRIQCLTIAWDTHKKRWYSLYPDYEIKHDDPLHWTKYLQNWNYMCAECHTTNLKKNFDVASNTYNTTWSEIDVSCEACHGPGSQHLAWTKKKYSINLVDDVGLAKLKDPSNKIMTETCAKCHAHRQVIYPGHHAGTNFMDYYVPSTMDHRELYHHDGQIKEEVYVYGSFVQSRMFHENVRCTDCHDPHTTKTYVQGNALCVRCHQPDKYNTPLHHKHKPGSTGSLCVECHMPETTYMQVDPRRDHSIRIPRPDLSKSLGSPNACNKCHIEKVKGKDPDIDWAIEHTNKLWGPKRVDDPHYGPALKAGLQNKPEGRRLLLELIRNPKRPAMVRASAIQMIVQYARSYAINDEIWKLLIAQLKDKDPTIRYAAVRAFESQNDQLVVQYLSPMLHDSIRAVRVEAARILSRTANTIPNKDKPAYQIALEEYKAGLNELADVPGSHVGLAVLAANQGNLSLAKSEYLIALKLDPTFVPAKMNLAMLYNQLGDKKNAEIQLREAIVIRPDYGEAYYSLGLLVAENPQRIDEVLPLFLKSVQLMPEHARSHYNLALLLMQKKELKKAEQFLIRAQYLDRNNPDIIYALVSLYSQLNQQDKVIQWVQFGQRAFPGDQRFMRR